MYATVVLVAALSAISLAAPAYPTLNVDAISQESLDIVSEYFGLLAEKVQQGKSMTQAPVCNLAAASVSLDADTTLPAPSAGLTLKHVAIGRGTQNYTCDANNATAAPVLFGALATLFNASCIAATYPDLLNMLPKVALQFNLTPAEQSWTSPSGQLAPTNLDISGRHFFLTTTMPYFDLDLDASLQLGQAPCSKNNSIAAPDGASTGQLGEAAVPWLKLIAKSTATGGLQEVYRVQTAGGSSPATCAGMPASFTVQYSAQYWFYEKA